MNNKTIKIFITSFCLLILLTIIGYSFGFFAPYISGNDTSSSFINTTANMEITNNGIISTSGVIEKPGDSFSQTFSITNTGNEVLASYSIYFSRVTNGFNRKTDLTYSLSCSSSSGSCDGKSATTLPGSEELMIVGSSINVGVTHTYTLIINYLEANEDQGEDMSKSFSAKITLNKMEYSSLKTYLVGASIPDVISDGASGSLSLNVEYTISLTSNYISTGAYVNCGDNTIEYTYPTFKITSLVDSNATCYISYPKVFSYTGSAQTYLTAFTGKYKLEVWGAQGGTMGSYLGGLGGYSIGTLSINSGTTLYVLVGSQGASAAAGYNGGGSATVNGRGGGGASDIRITTNSLYARVIVAGGGGGSGQDSCATGVPGYGGGLTGGGLANQGSCGTQAGGGTQTSGGIGGLYGGVYGTTGSFGQGGNAPDGSYDGGGGGGGWYGGGSGASAGWSNAGAGGSGYIYTSSSASNCPSGCLLNSNYYLQDSATNSGSTSFTNTAGTGNETGHSGNGYAKITYIGE